VPEKQNYFLEAEILSISGLAGLFTASSHKTRTLTNLH
jgi:hypothetical protein